MVASLLETVFITNIQFSSSEYSVVPNWLSVLVLQYIAVLVCLPPKKKSGRVTVFLNPSTRGMLLLFVVKVVAVLVHIKNKSNFLQQSYEDLNTVLLDFCI